MNLTVDYGIITVLAIMAIQNIGILEVETRHLSLRSSYFVLGDS